MPANPPTTSKLTVVKDDPAGAWAELMGVVREILAVYAECGGDLQ